MDLVFEATKPPLDPHALLAILRAVRKGDFTARLPLGHTGISGEIAEALNDVVELNERMVREFERISVAVGRDGRIDERASIGAVGGSWNTCVESVNSLVGDLVQPAVDVARVIGAVAEGDLSQRMASEVDGRPIKGQFKKTALTVNRMVDQLGGFASEVTRVAREVGTEGKLGGQAEVAGVAGTWKDLTDHVNSMAANLTSQVRNIAEVTTAVANGDLSKKITVTARGEISELKNTINTMVDQLNSFASEVSRVAREVGTEGKLGGQAEVEGVAGTWKDLTDNVNGMAANLTGQVRNIAEVSTAIASGDLSRKITVDVKGEILELKNTINTMVDQLNSFASEVTRVAREVGTEGKLGGQAQVKGVAGTWKDLTDNVNWMAANLTSQVRNIAYVTTAVANGDLSKKITVNVQGEILDLKVTINTMVDQLNSFASEVIRVAREVGTEGKLGGQAQVKGVGGTWKDLTDNVNGMAANLTGQVRNIAEVSTAIANGDLSRKITVDVKGEILDLKVTINTMVDQLNSFASEVTRVAREVGTDGKLGGQAQNPGVAGTWKDLTESVNFMAANLTDQVRNISEVTKAVAAGDLSKKITVDVKGEILELKNTINTMVDQLNGFASEVSRVAREVGTEGNLGGQARVPGVAGTWKDLTDNVNFMAANLTSQVRNIAEVTTAVANGDLSKKITVDVRGEILQLKITINTMVDQLNGFASEVTRVAREVGTEGKLGGQAQVRGVGGTWKDLTDNVNLMAANLTSQVRNIAEVTTAVANGDLSRTITVDVQGEILQLKITINTMVDQLNSFASEVTRVAREVGTEGKLGGQAHVKGVAGTWKDLTDNVNSMASNLTSQVRGIAKVVTGVANGNLKQKLAFEAKGEIASLANTINEMIDTLALFADQVTTVAREVGIEGKLGGQARVPGAAGMWRDLTDNVNQLAANLTTQVRAIAEVATAVAEGDLSRSITVQALGEVASLKDNINEMIRNLKDTTRKNTETDWLKTNLAKFTRLLQGQRDVITVAKTILSELARVVNAQHGVFYVMDATKNEGELRMLASYAYKRRRGIPSKFALGEGLVGQCALDKTPMLLTQVPSNYIQINSALGEAPPLNIIVLPVLFEGEVKAVIELASINTLSEIHLTFLEQLTEGIGIVLNTLSAIMRTEELLKQSQTLTYELQSQQEELKKTNERLEQQATTLRQSEELLRSQQEELRNTNEQLEEKARLLAEQKAQVEEKNREVEVAKGALEEKAEQLALTSKYKSQFLANMSHELRTPLNSLLILARLLADNDRGNLDAKQVEFSKTIHAAGSDLLGLINEILDLSKIESGTMAVDLGRVAIADLCEYVERSFLQVAEERRVDFRVEVDPDVPAEVDTDVKRLQQVVKNLLSNAFKFTTAGSVRLHIGVVRGGWSRDRTSLDLARTVIAFSVTDSGIGIPADKQRIIFEAFQQADMTTSRKYGGTGLGLSISREIAHLLGGELRVDSRVGHGSTFTLFLPQPWPGGATPPSAPPRAPLVLDVVPEPSIATLRATADDRASLRPGDRSLLIIEDDVTFAISLLAVARARGYKGLIATRGAEGLELARRYRPDAITLDVALPDIDGGSVLASLKQDPWTRSIPVHLISGAPAEVEATALRLGAVAVLEKPVTAEALGAAFANMRAEQERTVRHLLVVEDDERQRDSIVALLNRDEVVCTAVGTASAAIEALRREPFDGVVLDLELPDSRGDELITTIRRDLGMVTLPLIVYTGQELDATASADLQRISDAIIVKDADAPDVLLRETNRLLHHRDRAMGAARESTPTEDTDSLVDRCVLVVDDDLRNVFALTSVLERQQMAVYFATNGLEAIKLLQSTGDIDVILMDIMMPGIDGYDTMRAIRAIPELRSIPIIALTAKAMKGDREKCIEAGASDYIPKPVDTEQLLSMLRSWLKPTAA